MGKALATGAIPLRRHHRPHLACRSSPRPPRRASYGRWCGSARSASSARSPTSCCSSLLRPALGAQGANFAALLLTAIGNTTANRRLTFGVSGRRGVARHQLQGLGGVRTRPRCSPAARLPSCTRGRRSPSRALEAAVLVVANLAATLLRFLLLRRLGLQAQQYLQRDPPLPPSTLPGALDDRHDQRPDLARRARSAAATASLPTLRTRPQGRPALGAAGPAGACCRHRPALPVGSRRLGLGATPSTPRPSRPARTAGRRSSSARFDSSNFITVDKPPASLWVMDLSGADLRRQLLEHPGAAGARGRRGRRTAVRDRAAPVRPRCRADRRRGDGHDTRSRC